tara:strand:- start:443 stop:1072 length:630 start_codon:yes stop_codon:yes gene_type:complete
MPIGQTVDPAKVGSGTGNDGLNETAIKALGYDQIRPRFSVFAVAMHGPNFFEPPGVNDIINGSTDAAYLVAPDRDPASIQRGAGKSLEFEYEVREPIIFLNGELFFGTYYSTPLATSTTTIFVEKVNAAGDEVAILDQYQFNNNTIELGTVDAETLEGTGTNVLIGIPGGKSFFATDERFRLRVVPDSTTETSGLQNISAILWFKALHL